MGRAPELMSLVASIMRLIVAMRDMISFSKNKTLKPSNSGTVLDTFFLFIDVVKILNRRRFLDTKNLK